MKPVIFKLRLHLGLLLLLTVLYLNTAVIRGGGGFQVRFAYKPLHGLYPFYIPKSGEEGSWRQLAEGPNPPGWITGDYHLIRIDSSEGGTPYWLWLYRKGYQLTLWLWLLAVFRLLWRHRYRFWPRSSSTGKII